MTFSLATPERFELARLVSGLPEAQFEQLRFALNIPVGILPYRLNAQENRGVALLAWAEGPTGPGLKDVVEELNEIAPGMLNLGTPSLWQLLQDHELALDEAIQTAYLLVNYPNSDIPDTLADKLNRLGDLKNPGYSLFEVLDRFAALLSLPDLNPEPDVREALKVWLKSRVSDFDGLIADVKPLLQQYLGQQEKGDNSHLLIDVQEDDEGDRLVVSRKPNKTQSFTEPAIQLDLMLIPGGTFTMGSPPEELGRWDDEGLQHQVSVRPFLMGRYPVTQAQWKAIANRTDLKVKTDLDPDPSKFKGDDHPVEQVSWYEAVEFCDRLSRLTSHTYRLPTEAEWEYACRANTETPFHFGETITTDLANYCGEDDKNDPEEYPGHYGRGPKGVYRKTTTPVNHFHPLANAFGLCDMHGNVWEWCLDHWHDNYEGAPTDGSAWLTENEKASRVRRGGSWVNIPRDCRSACRYYDDPGYRPYDFGFRVLCEAPGL
jgi:formylglycine-generating enzyme required for sulfatase activity